jgi:hypothetical protein
MSRRIKVSLFLLATAAALVLLPSPFEAPASGDSPYASSLSDLIIEPAYAKPCPRTVCFDIEGDGKRPMCVSTSQRTTCTFSPTCSGTPC